MRDLFSKCLSCQINTHDRVLREWILDKKANPGAVVWGARVRTASVFLVYYVCEPDVCVCACVNGH